MTFKIGGVDFASYVAAGGFQFKQEDLDADTAGRDMSGTMHRQRVTYKDRLDIKCRPLTGTEASAILNAVLPQSFSVQFTSPMTGGLVTRTMYCSSRPASHIITKSGVDYWDGISLALVQL